MKTLKKYLNIYLQYVKIAFIYNFENPKTAVSYLFSAFIWSAVIFIIPYIVTLKVKVFYGLNSSELVLFSAVQILMLGLYNIFFTRNFAQLIDDVGAARFEFGMLMPVNTLFLNTCCKRIHPPQIVRVAIAIVVLFFALGKNHIAFAPTQALALLVFLGTSISMLYSLNVIATSFIFWMPHLDDLIELAHYFEGFTRYTREMFWSVAPFALIIVMPYTLLAHVPTLFVVGQLDLWNLSMYIFFATALNLAARVWFRFCLRRYVG